MRNRRKNKKHGIPALLISAVMILCGCAGEKNPDTTSGTSKGDDIMSTEKSTPAVPDTTYVYENLPVIPETVFPQREIIVADAVATNPGYGADPTGEKNSRRAIQKALDDVSEAGGGTVYLPAGKYMVDGSIKIPPFVTLRGDYNYSEDGGYGTVILDRQKSTTDCGQSLFILGGSGGVRGITVYYPEQDIDNVKPYPFTFYTTGQGTSYMLSTVQDCTVINGYAGIGACVATANPHEQFTVENLRGTFLCRGAEVYNQADVGTWKNLTVSPKYWAQAGAEYGAPSYERIAAYTRENCTGLILGDLEWTEFANIDISDCETGVRIVKGQRIEFAGSLFDFRVTGCRKALSVESIDSRWGMVIARSSFEGSEWAIRNNSGGIVKMTAVDTVGKVGGTGEISVDNDADLTGITTDYERVYPVPQKNLYVLDGKEEKGIKDISGKLQQLLDEAGGTGGIVYLPAGFYLLKKPVSVPAGVELRGSSSLPTRSQGGLERGTVILTDYGMDTGPEDAALVTLGGDGSGINGLKIAFFKNGPTVCKSTPYAVRGNGKGVYAVNCSIVASAYGIDFSGCDGHLIKKITICCYKNSILAGGKNGMIEGCLQNGTAIVRHKLPRTAGWVTEGEVFDKLFNPVTRKDCTFITVRNADGESILNTFCYGCAGFAVCEDSTDVLICNIGADNLGGDFLAFRSSDGTGVNLMRWNGNPVGDNVSSDFRLYNRITINDKHEPNQ
ncbi:MAG: hypothetical protein J5563_03710 [Clostridia bacterium]|nr:hypothetical protein [Clostridia bacterium]